MNMEDQLNPSPADENKKPEVITGQDQDATKIENPEIKKEDSAKVTKKPRTETAATKATTKKKTSAKKAKEVPEEKETTDPKVTDEISPKKKTATRKKKVKAEADKQEISDEVSTDEKPVSESTVEKEEPVGSKTKDKQSDLLEGQNGHEDEDEDEDEDMDHDDKEETPEAIDYEKLSREELAALLEETVKHDEINAIKKKVALIKVAFMKLNKEEQEKRYEEFISDEEDKEKEEEITEIAVDEIEERFNAAFDVFKEKRKLFNEKQEALKQQNLEKKKLILEDLKALVESEESLKKTYDEFRKLQDQWREIGMVPKPELNNLWQSYHFYVEKFFDKVKINKELRDLDLKKNLEIKIELCEKAEELLLETSILKSFKKLQQLHAQWKEVGPVPQDKNDEIWERFKSTTDKINQRRREHYALLKEDQNKNLAAKTVLAEKAEEILKAEINTIRDWQEHTNRISELLKVWKTIGPAPRSHNDEIWERFKTSLDTFFSGKKEFFQAIKEEQLHNYNLKLDLCAQAEAIKDSTDWRNTTRELIQLQKEWKNIGPVPRKYSDRIWKRFRAACDEFFNAKAGYFSNIKEHEAENLKLKEELISKVKEMEPENNKAKNLEILKDFQRQWTEIGHVPIKEKDKIQAAFRSAINNQLDKLKINKAEIQTMNYKQRIEGLMEKPNANRIINNELNFLHNKRKKMEEDVKLWENNIGFLASSKNADLLKEEFMRKITKVKDDINVITEKIKFLERETD